LPAEALVEQIWRGDPREPTSYRREAQGVTEIQSYVSAGHVALYALVEADGLARTQAFSESLQKITWFQSKHEFRLDADFVTYALMPIPRRRRLGGDQGAED
jgi:hypothetical protein